VTDRSRKGWLLGALGVAVAFASLAIATAAQEAAAQSSPTISVVPFDLITQFLLWVIGALGFVVMTVLALGARFLKGFFTRADGALQRADAFREELLQWKATSEAVLPNLTEALERMEEDVREVRRTVEVKIGEMGVLAETSREAAEQAQRHARDAYRIVERDHRDASSRTRRSDIGGTD
jgi:hypothetical protein